jgi:predicted ester cyclase
VVATFGRCARTSPTWPSRTKSSHAAFVNHDAPGRAVDCRRQPPPVEHFNHFYGMLLQAFPDASMEINEQVAERDLGFTRKTLRGTHRGEPWAMTPPGNRVEWEFSDIFGVRDGEAGGALDAHALRGPASASAPAPIGACPQGAANRC